MKLQLLSVVMFCGLAGCASSEIVRGPNGADHNLVTCVTITSCYEKATEICGGKYQIVNSSDGLGSYSKQLLVKCEKSVESTVQN